MIESGCPIFDPASATIPEAQYPIIVKNVDVSDTKSLQDELEYCNP